MADNDQFLQKIGNLIDTKLDDKLEPIIRAQEQQGRDISALRNGQEWQGKAIEAQGNDIAGLRKDITERGKDITSFKAGQKKQDKKINRVQKDIKLILQYHDEMHIHLRGRVEALEEKASHN